jgi:nucleotide-binding universal stress UspA family protein
MLAVRRILFPVDFSERCSAAAAHVAAQARHFKAKVTVLHVTQIAPLCYGDLAAAELASRGIQELMDDRRAALDTFQQNEMRDLEGVDKVVERGDPARVITQYSRQEKADLIMMPTHGYGPFRRLLLGSVTAKVLHDAACPVWTDVHDEMTFSRLGCQSVVCAVDLRDESVSEIQWAAELASSYGAELTLVHAIPAAAGPVPPEENRFRHHLVETAREYMDELQCKAGTTAKVSIERGKIARTVRNAALEYAADLVVIGQGCLHEVLGRLRSNAYAIIRESPCPVVRA